MCQRSPAAGRKHLIREIIVKLVQLRLDAGVAEEGEPDPPTCRQESVTRQDVKESDAKRRYPQY